MIFAYWWIFFDRYNRDRWHDCKLINKTRKTHTAALQWQISVLKSLNTTSVQEMTILYIMYVENCIELHLMQASSKLIQLTELPYILKKCLNYLFSVCSSWRKLNKFNNFVQIKNSLWIQLNKFIFEYFQIVSRS